MSKHNIADMCKTALSMTAILFGWFLSPNAMAERIELNPLNSWDSGPYADTVADGGYLYAAGSSGLAVFELADPAAPVFAGTLTGAAPAFGVAKAGDYVYLTGGEQGVWIINVADPGAPLLTASHDTPGVAGEIAVAGDYAYVADGAGGLQIINISTPAAPSAAGVYFTPLGARGVAVAGNHAYVADGFSGLHIIDIADPAAPLFKGNEDKTFLNQ
ncbi:MAG: hypothetical protein GY862_02260 [Gammaproteobacteria bacterium]|nr:hypothetical protein [Gammaproteobacteria bacterium]